MKKTMKLIMAVIIGMLMVACGNEKKIEKIYVGTNAEFAPFEYLEDGKTVGFDMDLMAEISKEIGVEMEIKDMAFDGLLPALQAKKVDMIIAGMTATEERKKAVNFSETYYKANQVIITAEDAEDIPDFEGLKGKKVGVILGFTGDVVVSEIDGVEVKKYNAGYAAIMDLKEGKIDAVVLDGEPAKNFVKNNEGIKITSAEGEKEEYAMAVSKDNKELLEKVDSALITLKENGTYDKLLKKWF
ncbi:MULTISPECIES: basic amino acid ABC transporter substrate-binding protein [Psychrilyobacter]|uniref:Basic amino acid ABC transporter substrate-binding protein n=1 Tax=Psychrilyobacter piezotolerans TaxID=2293438 RepID=A0ABX9KDC6_9FUSO|nr:MULTISPECIES: basic amino acid ABC transporter substrate-binding protein [Psychrilyobacter]MCS5422377.1 basic amino acid ABC transporter substrate-binding protein [Psychrilyobacter sp. S5]NDI79110.1 basic amino acid ABC transporter substrate-binding protein [Psychrilyobacter piezotolerans]RDE58983.1 basic amino acid ABC transporter substrate-binding protein [Psychrilyobacter sp. S5]REI39550.1 basic amino acid ABC transporter substrate-binding protein [Psychrilyobacter piezotolerans]